MTRSNDPNPRSAESPNDPVLTPLLDEALSPQSSDVRASGDLSDRVIAATAHHFAPPSDATLDPLLDEALAPSDVPADLSATIYAATRDYFDEPVLARLSPGRWTAWTAAAAIVLIIAGVWVFRRKRPRSIRRSLPNWKNNSRNVPRSSWVCQPRVPSRLKRPRSTRS